MLHINSTLSFQESDVNPLHPTPIRIVCIVNVHDRESAAEGLDFERSPMCYL